MTADDYLQVLLQLLPPGKAYPRDLEGELPATLAALADEFGRIDLRTANLVDEADPRTAVEMIPDWERALALPDECTGPLNTLAERRQAILATLTETGGQSREYFIRLAASLGYSITITEFRPFTCVTPIDQGIYDENVRFVWRVNAPETTIRESTCQSPCTDPIRSWGNIVLECTIDKRKPAHTTVIYAYGG